MADKSVLSRRDFLKVMGAAGFSASLPLLPQPKGSKDISKTGQELDSAGWAPRPFWVKKASEPTIEIDWEKIQRFDARSTVLNSDNFANLVGEERVKLLASTKADNEQKRILANMPGYTLKDYALHAASLSQINKGRSFLGLRQTATPQDRGVPDWSGSQDEAARILRVAMRHFGAANVGFVELNENTRKLIYSFDPDGKELVFEDVPQAYETDEKRAIPLSAKWAIVYAVQMSGETIRSAPTITATQTETLSYHRGKVIQNSTQEFLRGLGYQCLGQSSPNALGITPAFGVLAGLGELSRLNRVITPEFGPIVRLFLMITDLPVTTDQPIDAGIMRFCRTCKKCAEVCPASALSYADEPTWQVKGSWNNPGHKAYYEDSVKCYTYWQEQAGSECSICFSVCPFSNKDKAWVHPLAKATISLLPVTDGFLRTMDDAFSYGAQEDPTNWWYLNLPEYGVDSDPFS